MMTSADALNLRTYDPGHRLVLETSHEHDPQDAKKADVFALGTGLRVMLLWPLAPLWLLGIAVLSLKGKLDISKPLWPRRITWDGAGKRLVIKYGLWPLFFDGRKSVRFSDIRAVSMRIEGAEDGAGRVVLHCHIRYGGSGQRSLSWTQQLAGSEADAKELCFRIARLLGWQFYHAQRKEGALLIALAAKKGQQATIYRDEVVKPGKRIPSRKKSAMELQSRRAEAEEEDEDERPKRGSLEQVRKDLRHSKYRIDSWRPRKRIVLSRSWDGPALLIAVLVAIPVFPVGLAFLGVGAVLFLLFPMALVWELWAGAPKDLLFGLCGAAYGLGAVVFTGQNIAVFLREHSARQVVIDWSTETVRVSSLTRSFVVAFEDIDSLIVRSEWPGGEAPAKDGPLYDCRNAIDLQHHGSAVPARILEVPNTRIQPEQGHVAVRGLGMQLARVLDVRYRSLGYEMLHIIAAAKAGEDPGWRSEPAAPG